MNAEYAEARRIEWCQAHQNDQRVIDWLAANPPPDDWQGTPVEYAYNTMPTDILRSH